MMSLATGEERQTTKNAPYKFIFLAVEKNLK